MQNRRQSIRWQINESSNISLEETQVFSHSIIKDINLKGIQVSSSLKLPRDKFLKLTVVSAKGLSFVVEGWVAWHKTIMETNSYGLYFSKIRDLDKQRIYEFVRKHCPEQMTKSLDEGLTEPKGGEDMEDRRIFERLPTKLPLRYLEQEKGQEGKGQIQDISAKGVCFVSDGQLAPRSSLELWIDMPDKGEPLYARGEVVWTEMLSPDKCKAGVCLEKANLMGLSRVLRTL